MIIVGSGKLSVLRFRIFAVCISMSWAYRTMYQLLTSPGRTGRELWEFLRESSFRLAITVSRPTADEGGINRCLGSRYADSLLGMRTNLNVFDLVQVGKG
jgi:hypothetical protein